MFSSHQEYQSPPPLSVDQELTMTAERDEKPETHNPHHHPHGDGGLRIKLKIRSPSSECSSDDQDNDQENRVCKLCKKGFSSGRALGGHMRVHYQMLDQQQQQQQQQQHHSSSDLNNKILHHHPKLIKKQTPTQSNLNATERRSPLTAKNISTTCTECGKTFPSLKSLFGHMRCHPEREWRGIHPPPDPSSSSAKNYNNSSSSTISDSTPQKNNIDDHPIDSAPTTTSTTTTNEPSFPSWSVTAKRGRKSIGSINSGRPISEVSVCGLLLMLANGGDSSSNKQTSEESENSDSSKKRRSQDSEPENRDLVPKKPKIGASAILELEQTAREQHYRNYFSKAETKGRITNGVNGYHRQSANMDNSGGNYYYSDEEEEEEEESEQHRVEENDDVEEKGNYANHHYSPIITEIRKKKKLLKDLQTTMVEEKGVGVMDYNHKQSLHAFPDRYKCTTCNKSFSTHQALGGHKSSHNKGKNIALNNNNNTGMEEELALADAATGKEQQYEVAVSKGFDDSGVKTGENTHRCQICKKTFPTGQALGGHKRCHWTGPAEAPISSAAAAAAVLKEETGQTKRHAVEFDLNELPPVEDEEGVVVSDSYQLIGNNELVDYPSSSSYSSAT